MRSIEFFGVPCSGKTHIYKNLIKYLKKTKSNFFSYKSIIYKFAHRELELSKVDQLSIKYFKLIKSNDINLKIVRLRKTNIRKKKYLKLGLKNPVSTMFYKKYRVICNKIFYKFKKKNKFFVSKFLHDLEYSNIENLKKQNYKNWFIELCAAKYLLHKYHDEIDILIDDEGFIQRAFMFINFKNNKKLIKTYLRNKIKPNLIINIKAKKSDINKRSKKRKLTNEFQYDSLSEIKKYLFFEKFVLNQLKNQNVLKINNLYNTNKLIKNICLI